MASYGCHAIEPDNLDSYSFSNGFGLTVNDAMDYMSWVAASVHDLVPMFEFVVVESCAESPGSCEQYAPFIQAGKPVFAAEYTDAGSGDCPVISSVATACATTNGQGFEGIIKACNLGAGTSPSPAPTSRTSGATLIDRTSAVARTIVVAVGALLAL